MIVVVTVVLTGVPSGKTVVQPETSNVTMIMTRIHELKSCMVRVKPLLYIDRIIFSTNFRFIGMAKDHLSPGLSFWCIGVSTSPGFFDPS